MPPGSRTSSGWPGSKTGLATSPRERPSSPIIPGLTKEEIKALKENLAEPELESKGAKALGPKLTLFLGKIIKAAMVLDPNCTCLGKGCEE